MQTYKRMSQCQIKLGQQGVGIRRLLGYDAVIWHDEGL